jgi:hypothetical protein
MLKALLYLLGKHVAEYCEEPEPPPREGAPGTYVNKGKHGQENWVWKSFEKPDKIIISVVKHPEGGHTITMDRFTMDNAIESIKCTSKFEADIVMDNRKAYYKSQGRVRVKRFYP